MKGREGGCGVMTSRNQSCVRKRRGGSENAMRRLWVTSLS